MVILESSQDKRQEPLDTEGIDKTILTKESPQKNQVDEMKLKKLRKKCQKLQKIVSCSEKVSSWNKTKEAEEEMPKALEDN